MNEEKLILITKWLKWNIFRNADVMYDRHIREAYSEYIDNDMDLIDIIAALHNLLYECVTGERYDYMFHWANKVGADCWDNIFDNLTENMDEIVEEQYE